MLRWIPASWLLVPTLLAGPAAPGALHAQDGALPLWEVSDGNRTIHLLGSIHLLRPDAYPLDDTMYEIFDAVEVAVFELDLDEVRRAGPVMMSRGMLPEDSTLHDALPGELAAELEQRLTESGLPAEAVRRMKPWMAALSLSSTVLQQSGFEAESSIDLHFHRRALESGMRVVGLETIEEQIEVFDGLGADAQAAFVRQTLDELDEIAERMDDATALWKRGDADGLARMFSESLHAQPELTERLLYTRNRVWIEEVEALLASGEPAIVIVGMGHLVGSGSVVDLLRERGYEVSRVQTRNAAGT